MTIIAAVGGALFLLSTIVGGLRLLWLARQTRELPEFVLGIGLFAMGGIGTPLMALARAPLGWGPGFSAACLFASCGILTLGMAGFALFTRRVFRPNARWAGCLAFALPGWMLAGMVLIALGDGFAAAARQPGTGYAFFQTGTAMILAWCAFESTRYAIALRRRVQLGLAEPVVANRILLWASAMVIATALSAGATLGQIAGINVMGSPEGLTFVGCFGTVAAGAIYLAFLPPKAYTGWVTARAAAAD